MMILEVQSLQLLLVFIRSIVLKVMSFMLWLVKRCYFLLLGIIYFVWIQK